MSSRTKTVTAVIIDLMVPVFTVIAVAQIFFSNGFTQNSRAWLRFFTNESNVLASAACLITAAALIHSLHTGEDMLPRWVYILKFASSVSVAVTFATCVLFLAPVTALAGGSYFMYFDGGAFFLHFFSPVLCMVSVTLLEQTEQFSFRDAMWGMLPTFLYSWLYFVKVAVTGPSNGGWEDFYGFTFGGNMKMVPVAFIMMYGLTLLLVFLLFKAARRRV